MKFAADGLRAPEFPVQSGKRLIVQCAPACRTDRRAAKVMRNVSLSLFSSLSLSPSLDFFLGPDRDVIFLEIRREKESREWKRNARHCI